MYLFHLLYTICAPDMHINFLFQDKHNWNSAEAKTEVLKHIILKPGKANIPIPTTQQTYFLQNMCKRSWIVDANHIRYGIRIKVAGTVHFSSFSPLVICALLL